MFLLLYFLQCICIQTSCCYEISSVQNISSLFLYFFHYFHLPSFSFFFPYLFILPFPIFLLPVLALTTTLNTAGYKNDVMLLTLRDHSGDGPILEHGFLPVSAWSEFGLEELNRPKESPALSKANVFEIREGDQHHCVHTPCRGFNRLKT